MRKGRRVLALLMALTLVFAGLVQASAEETASGRYFPDVPDGKWYTTPVNYLAEKEVVHGKNDGTYDPQGTVTRAEFVVMLAGISGHDLSKSQKVETFSDVRAGSWYEPYVKWGVHNRVIGGVGNNRFNPGGAITRQEIAAILWRFNKNVMGKVFPVYRRTYFKDRSSISSWAATEVTAVEGAGILNGYTDQTFRPKKNATRAETAQILYKYLISCKEYRSVGYTLQDIKYVMHGGGEYWYYQTTNSFDAVKDSYAKGNKFIELDFSWTLDNQLICLHEWGGPNPQRMTLENFMKQKIYGKFSPLSLDLLANWMRTTAKDVFIVTDIKANNVGALRQIAQKYPDLKDRFITYIYHTNEYDSVHSLGFENIVLILYDMKASEKADPDKLVSFAKSKNLAGIAIAPKADAAYFDAVKGSGIPLWVYVVDSKQWMNDMWAQGADVFITNKPLLKMDF